MSNSIDRRGFGRVCAGLVAVALAGGSRVARAADLPHVDEAGPQAKALGYVHDAAAVVKAKYPAFVEGSHCATCQLYQGGTAEWGPCPLFAGNAVSAKGWCSAYAKKA